MSTHRTRSAADTLALGRRFARSLRPGHIVALLGSLGSGKTCLVTGICEGLGVQVPVSSPTFALINEYPAPFGMVVHCDLYRIRRKEELAELGLEEYFTARNICLIEWAESIMHLLPPGTRVVRSEHGSGRDDRLFSIEPPLEEGA